MGNNPPDQLSVLFQIVFFQADCHLYGSHYFHSSYHFRYISLASWQGIHWNTIEVKIIWQKEKNHITILFDISIYSIHASNGTPELMMCVVQKYWKNFSRYIQRSIYFYYLAKSYTLVLTISRIFDAANFLSCDTDSSHIGLCFMDYWTHTFCLHLQFWFGCLICDY